MRERLEDVPEIARHLVGRITKAQGRAQELTEAAIGRLTQYTWPGNVREMENCLERAAVMSESGRIESDLIRIDRAREASLARAPLPSARQVDVNDPELSER